MGSANDKSQPPLIIRLSDYGIGAGDVLNLKQLGAFQYTSGQPENGTRMIGLFSRTNSVQPVTTRYRVPGAIKSGPGSLDPATYVTKLWTDIPEDFAVLSDGTKVTVPSGAQFLMVAARDSMYADNIDTNHDYAVTLQILGTSSSKLENTLMPLLTPGVWYRSGANAIGSNGVIGGWVGSPDERYSAVFADRQATTMDFLDCGESAIYGMNKSGTVVGESMTPQGKLSAFQAVGTLLVDILKERGRATSINSIGQICGYRINGDDMADPFVYSGGKLRNIQVNPSRYGVANAINERGDVVGAILDSTSTIRFMLAKRASDGTYTTADLSAPAFSIGVDLNENGEHVGNYMLGEVLRAFIIDKNGFRDIGTLPGGISTEAAAINNLGQVVGRATTIDGEVHAFFYDGKKMMDLGALDGYMSGANDINDQGTAVGTALDINGIERAFAVSTKTWLDVTVNPALVRGGVSAAGTLTLRTASYADTKVSLSCDSSAVNVPQSVTIPAGSLSVTFPIATTQVGELETDTISAVVGDTTFTTIIKLRPSGVASLRVSPDYVAEGGTTTATVTLDETPTHGPIKVLLACSPVRSATFPTSIEVPVGQRTATFSVRANAADDNKIVMMTAATDSTSASGAFTIRPMTLKSFTLDSTYLLEGAHTTGRISLEKPAPAGGKTVNLASSDKALVVPATVSFPEGAQTASFPVKTGSVDAQTRAIVTADYFGGRLIATATVRPLAIDSFTIPTTITEGTSASVTVKLEGPAPVGGRTVTLSGDSILKLPAEVTVPEGAASTTLTIKAKATTKSVAASITGRTAAGLKTAKVAVAPIKGLSVAFTINYFPEGTTVPLVVKLDSPAPEGGKLVILTKSNLAVTLPAGVTIPEGQSQVTVDVLGNETDKNTPFTISAAVNETTKQVPGTVRSNTLRDLYLSSYTIKSGQTVDGGFNLEFPALTSGKTIRLSTDNPVAQIAPSVYVPAGAKTGKFRLAVGTVTNSTTVTVTALCGDRISRMVFKINP